MNMPDVTASYGMLLKIIMFFFANFTQIMLILESSPIGLPITQWIGSGSVDQFWAKLTWKIFK